MENSRGFHHPGQRNFEQGGSGQGAMMPGGGGKKGMAEPTNHAGHTHAMSRRHESDARIERHRSSHDDHSMGKHEKILHETHKLHQHGAVVSQSKYGASHYLREHESKAERKAEGE
jgi:hypothetical protein